MRISIAGMSVAFATGTYVVISADSKWLVVVLSCVVPIALYTIKIWPSWYREVVNGFHRVADRKLIGREVESQSESVGKWKPPFIRLKISENRKIHQWRPNSMTYFHTPQPRFLRSLSPVLYGWNEEGEDKRNSFEGDLADFEDFQDSLNEPPRSFKGKSVIYETLTKFNI